MRRTRILLVEMPRMLSDIITDEVENGSDLEVVGVLPDRDTLAAMVVKTRADVVVLRLRDRESPDGDECRSLLAAHPQMKVLGVSADSRRTFLFELRPTLSALGEVSPEELLDAIRAAVDARPMHA